MVKIVHLNGKRPFFDTEPIDGSTYVIEPLRLLSEYLNGK